MTVSRCALTLAFLQRVIALYHISGAFHIACRRGLPVVPIAIVLKERTGKIWRFLGLPPRVLVTIGQALHPVSASRSAEEDLASRARGAIQAATNIVSAQPGYSDAVMFLAAIYVRQTKTDAAVDVLEKGVAANPKNVAMRMQLSQLYSNKNERDKVERLLREL